MTSNTLQKDGTLNLTDLFHKHFSVKLGAFCFSIRNFQIILKKVGRTLLPILHFFIITNLYRDKCYDESVVQG